jgi:membrane protein
MEYFKNIMSNTFLRFTEHEIFTRSAALSYYSSLAMAPLLLLFIAILGLLNLNMQDQLILEISQIFGDQAAKLLSNILISANSKQEFATLSGALGIGFLLFSASIIFTQLQDTLNIIFNSTQEIVTDQTFKEKIQLFMTQRLLSFGMVFTFIFIVTISMIASTIISFAFKDSPLWLIKPAQFVINLIVFQLLFMMIIKILPNKKISYKRSAIAGAIISILFVLGKSVIGLYIGNTAVGSAYGAAGSLAIMLVWFYYSALIIYFGAELSYSLVLEE